MVIEPASYYVTYKPKKTWRQLIMRMAEPFNQVRSCLDVYEALLPEFTDPDDTARADAAWDALLLGGCLAGAKAAQGGGSWFRGPTGVGP